MAQSALTVTAPNPTPPTNLACTGATPPNPPNYSRRTVGPPPDIITNPPPYFEDGVPAQTTSALLYTLNETSASATISNSIISFIGNTAALTSGTSAADNNTGTTAGTTTTAAGGTGFNSAIGTYPGATSGLVPASTSVAHEGAGTETLATWNVQWPGNTNVYNPSGPLRMVGCGPALTVGVTPQPNQTHASSLSPATNPTLTSVSAGGASGGGTAVCTATGTNFTRQSVLNINGINYPTTYTSSTSIAATAPKKATAGSLPVFVTTGGVVITATVNWTFT